MNELILPNILDGEDKTSPFKNCIRNHYRHIRKWAKRTHTDCFRIYNHQIPSYQLDIDFYSGRFCIHYFSRKGEECEPPLDLKNEVTQVLQEMFQTEVKEIFWRTRFRRKKIEQYEKVDTSQEFFVSREYGAKFRINLMDYLDTGLFLDHRVTRKMVAGLSKNRRVLNLFAYTCAFTVHAALGGAAFTKSVDMSNTYLAWGRENLLLNSLSLRNNRLVRADCLKFLDQEIEKYDVIIIDPPTLSRSKKMDQIFDVQIDYPTLIFKALKLLYVDGVIFFSTNSRRFVFDQNLFPECLVEDISRKTLPLDFFDPKIHRCWKISYLKK